MTKADVFLVISQIYIAAVNKENKVLLVIFGSLWLMLYFITLGTLK